MSTIAPRLFPRALVNGHLSSANSDVRAGDNLEKHDGRWSGLSGWWQNLFGLLNPSDKGQRPAETYAETAVPPNPRVSEKEGIDKAVHDFLSSWLLEQKPNLAAAYFSKAQLSVPRGACSREGQSCRGWNGAYPAAYGDGQFQ